MGSPYVGPPMAVRRPTTRRCRGRRRARTDGTCKAIPSPAGWPTPVPTRCAAPANPFRVAAMRHMTAQLRPRRDSSAALDELVERAVGPVGLALLVEQRQVRSVELVEPDVPRDRFEVLLAGAAGKVDAQHAHVARWCRPSHLGGTTAMVLAPAPDLLVVGGGLGVSRHGAPLPPAPVSETAPGCVAGRRSGSGRTWHESTKRGASSAIPDVSTTRSSTSCWTRPRATWTRPSAGSPDDRTRTVRTACPPRSGVPERAGPGRTDRADRVRAARGRLGSRGHPEPQEKAAREPRPPDGGPPAGGRRGRQRLNGRNG